MANWSEDARKVRDLARFWKHTLSNGNCLIFTLAADKCGYGKFTTTIFPKIQTTHQAHRWIYQQCLGRLPAEIILMHSCDNPACVKLQHLQPGTPAQNVRDMTQKKRGKGYFTKGQDPRRKKLKER